MKSKIKKSDPKAALKFTFPVAMRLKYDERLDSDDPFRTGQKELIVLFTTERDGIVIHQVNTPHQLFQPSVFSPCTGDSWEKFTQIVELDFS